MPRSSGSYPRGRAEPAPPRGGQALHGRPSGERPETTRETVFSEGRGLRVRKHGPDVNRGRS
jgi:hypothetical protein